MPLPAIGGAAARAANVIAKSGLIPQIKISNLFSVESIMMLSAAALLDILGLVGIIPLIGTFIAFIVTVVGFLFIGSWLMFFRGKSPILRRAGLLSGGTLAESIPILNALPFWTGVVLIELLLGN